MPKLREKTNSNDVVIRELKKAMIDADVPTYERLAERLMITSKTVSRRFKQPTTWTVKELRRLDKIMGLSDAAITALLGR